MTFPIVHLNKQWCRLNQNDMMKAISRQLHVSFSLIDSICLVWSCPNHAILSQYLTRILILNWISWMRESNYPVNKWWHVVEALKRQYWRVFEQDAVELEVYQPSKMCRTILSIVWEIHQSLKFVGLWCIGWVALQLRLLFSCLICVYISCKMFIRRNSLTGVCQVFSKILYFNGHFFPKIKKYTRVTTIYIRYMHLYLSWFQVLYSFPLYRTIYQW